MQPIGSLLCKTDYRFEAPRQSTLANNCGVIELNPGHNFEQALNSLNQFDRIWVIYLFHNNSNWKPMVTPPRGGKKVGVFASRSPHRPSQIGLSCVEVEKVEGRKIYIKNFDILNGSPILDIKPYISYCDSFPEASTGWLPEQLDTFEVKEAEAFTLQAQWVLDRTGFDLSAFAQVQLSEDPLNCKRKRIKICDAEKAVLAYRTWRIHFEVSGARVQLIGISSGYSVEDLEVPEDKYGDKGIHRQFKEIGL
ncbi:MAG: tRNA (N6-threonylcarbamoyladenosine(37)-N6)-methyltransferase TrmO [Lentisphaeria bacterium]|nr:tRNA (N6-threonylcarbamoyladenosine(37)-N6)-methyltransferase TrmO [Lentisphaeria bacterium]